MRHADQLVGFAVFLHEFPAGIAGEVDVPIGARRPFGMKALHR